MPKQTPKNIPHLVIVESPANDLYLMLDGLITGGSHLALQALEDVKEKGKQFERQAEGKELKNAIASGLFQDREKAGRILARLESLLKQEPRLLVTADVLSKYLREIKAFLATPSSSIAEKPHAGATRSTTPGQSDDWVYYLLGLFSLVMNVLTSAEVSQVLRSIKSGAENSAENSAEARQSDKKRNVTSQRATVLRSKSRLLR